MPVLDRKISFNDNTEVIRVADKEDESKKIDTIAEDEEENSGSDTEQSTL